MDGVRPEGDRACRLSAHFSFVFFFFSPPCFVLSSLPSLLLVLRCRFYSGGKGEGGDVDTLVRLLVQQAASMPVNGSTSTHTHTHTSSHTVVSDICNMFLCQRTGSDGSNWKIMVTSVSSFLKKDLYMSLYQFLRLISISGMCVCEHGRCCKGQ